MSAAQRVGAVLRISPQAAQGLVVVALVGTIGIIAIAIELRVLPLVVVATAGAVVVLACLRWPLLGLIALVVLIPVEEMGTIGEFGTLSRLAGILFALTYALPRLTSIRLSAMPLAGWAFLGWALASTAWSGDPATSLSELPTLIQLFAVAVLIADFVVRQPTIGRPILIAYSLSAAAAALIGVASYLVGSGLSDRAAAIEGQNPAQYAAVLLPAFAFGFNEVLNGRRRAAGGLIALVTLAAIVLSGTRGAWVAVAVVPLLMIPRLSPRRIVLVGAAVAAMAIVTYQLPGIPGLVSDRLGNAISTGGAGRADIWSAGLVIYTSSPVLGVGYANFPIAYTPEVVRAANITSDYILSGRAPHNIIVGTLAELGPVGLVLISMFLLPLAVRRGWGPDAVTVQTTLASLLTLALFLDIVANRKQVWLVIGLAAGLWYLERHRSDSPRQVRDASSDSPP